MARGWVRGYVKELETFGFRDRSLERRNARAEFRRDFRTMLHQDPDSSSAGLMELSWGDEVELPSGIQDSPWTEAIIDGQVGFIGSGDVVEVAYIKRRDGVKDGLRSNVSFEKSDGNGGSKTVKVNLIWGDCVQIMHRVGEVCEVRARCIFGEVPTAHLTSEPLMEVYFIDVGQGDGVLVRTPDGRHLLVDGGLERKKQQTGKNAADFVDWKFFQDYGHYQINLDSMTASHSDNDHYGGLHDLVRLGPQADRELDCLSTHIHTLHHPGLSRWSKQDNVDPPHKHGLGPATEDAAGDDFFVRLLDDREDAEKSVEGGGDNRLSGPWNWFIRDVLKNDADTRVQRTGVDRESIGSGATLPDLWNDAEDYRIKVLGPVAVSMNGKPALPDMGSKPYNTNGHSICYRIDYGKARILLTGDLNKPSMDWLAHSYGDRIGAWRCDVAKACHHGSHKVSFRFLQEMNPAATIISSGDAEGHAHPRPEIVGASAIAGRVEVDLDKDILLTPLVYMTEVERSVTIGAVDRLDFAGLPIDGEDQSGMMLGRHMDEINDKALLTPDQMAEIKNAPAADRKELQKQLRQQTRDSLREIETRKAQHSFKANYYMTVPNGPVSSRYQRKPFWRSRVIDKNHYGLVNVRTDGEVIMCATMNETEESWIVHAFPARSNPG